MNLVFPFTNITINTFLDFLDKDAVKLFIKAQEDEESWAAESFKNDVQHSKDYLPDLENEILQVINTSDQNTIDTYFQVLSDGLASIREKLNRDYILAKIKSWNDDAMIEYVAKVNDRTAEYMRNENRKLKHLEEYDDYEFSHLFLGIKNDQATKVKKVNHNFYCITEVPEVISEDIVNKYLDTIKPIADELFQIAGKYGKPWQNGEIKSKAAEPFVIKPILLVEGAHDINYIKKAAVVLNKANVLEKIDIRQRGGSSKLDKIWGILKEDSWETVPQKKILLYDCDTNKQDEDFGTNYKRMIPSIPTSRIKRGIENLFPDLFIDKAIQHKKDFIDIKRQIYSIRGVDTDETHYEVNKEEKTNLCNWACENGTEEDFKNFEIIFDIIEGLIK